MLERTTELEKAKDKAEQLARIDALTEVSNRRYFEEVATREFTRAQRYQQPLSVVMFDIDLFKQVNDTYGHAAGDSVLKVVANVAKDAVRDIDFVARIGGEEFAILLPGVTIEQAMVTTERVRVGIANYSFDYQGQIVTFTASFGVSQLKKADQNFDALLLRVDQAMYMSKDAGRNKVSVLEG